jgi:regulator of RNase E activity RraA
VSEDLARRLSAVPACTAMDLLRGDEPESLVMRGVRPLLPVRGAVAGRARTLRFLPARVDVKTPPRGRPHYDLLDDVKPGDILVFDTVRGLGGAVLGDMLALRAKTAGALAVVTDGVMRDLPGHEQVGLPVFASGTWPIPTATTMVAWERDVPIQCGGALVMPGDWILADWDAVLVLPQKLAEKVAEGAPAALEQEKFCRELLARGHRLANAFPMPAKLRPLYDEYKRTGVMPGFEQVVEATT